MLFLLFKNFNVVCIIQYFSEFKMFKIIIVIVIILMMMMTFKDQFLLPYTCNIRVLFLNKVFLLSSLLSLLLYVEKHRNICIACKFIVLTCLEILFVRFVFSMICIYDSIIFCFYCFITNNDNNNYFSLFILVNSLL